MIPDSKEAQEFVKRIEAGADPDVEGLFCVAKRLMDRSKEENEPLPLKDALHIASQLRLANEIDGLSDWLSSIQESVKELDTTIAHS